MYNVHVNVRVQCTCTHVHVLASSTVHVHVHVHLVHSLQVHGNESQAFELCFPTTPICNVHV